MSIGEWTAVGGLVLALLTAIYSSMKVIVRSIMKELQPNAGSSLKDQVTRIEARLDHIYTQFLQK